MYGLCWQLKIGGIVLNIPVTGGLVNFFKEERTNLKFNTLIMVMCLKLHVYKTKNKERNIFIS